MESYNQDAYSSYYEERKRQGKTHTFWMGKVSGGDISWQERDHRNMDGLGAFVQELSNTADLLFDFPTIKNTARPEGSTPQETIEKALERKQQWSVQWEVDHNERSSNYHTITWNILEEETKKSIEKHLVKTHATLNSFLIAKLSRALGNVIAKKQSEFYWAVPINMRGAVSLEDKRQNHFSVISVKASSESTAESIHEEVKQQLQSGEHWAYWDIFQIMAQNPDMLSHAVQNAGSSIRMGTFSNLGEWKTDRLKNEDMWVFVPSITFDSPIAVGVITLNDRLGLAIHIDPSLSLSQDETTQIMNEWCDSLKE